MYGKSDIPSTTKSFFQSLDNPYVVEPTIQPFKLKSFDGSDNKIYAEEDDHNLSPKFQLESLYLSSHGQGRVPKLVDREQHIPESLYLENCSFRSILTAKEFSCESVILSISMNYFQGQIPAEIGAYLPGLQVLMMSDNFDGSIPSSLGSMSSCNC
uniref:Uncharacterized protein n=1 Tax=Salix viminalis TaxID=40686 RepID=A0A6N2KLM5_SALVM